MKRTRLQCVKNSSILLPPIRRDYVVGPRAIGHCVMDTDRQLGTQCYRGVAAGGASGWFGAELPIAFCNLSRLWRTASLKGPLGSSFR